MKKPRRKAAAPKPIPEPAPLLTFEQARAGVLSEWYDGKDLTAGTRIATPKDAAAHGLLAALNVNDGQRGVVRILVANPEQKREVINYLTAFLTDEDRLKRLLKRTTPDTFFLHGNVSIVVDANAARLGKGVISQIVLDPEVGKPIGTVWLQSGETKEEAAARCGWKPEQVSQLMSIRWLDPALGEVAPPVQHPLDPVIEQGPPDEPPGALSTSARPVRAEPDPIDMAAAERKWRDAVEREARERQNERLAEAYRRLDRSIC